MFYLITGELILLLALCIGDHKSFDDFKNYTLLQAMLSCIGAAALFIATWPLWFIVIIVNKLRASS